MELQQLTDEQLDAAFKEASDNGESLTPFIQEKAERMNLQPKKQTGETCPVDPMDGLVCDSCQ